MIGRIGAEMIKRPFGKIIVFSKDDKNTGREGGRWDFFMFGLRILYKTSSEL